MEVLLGAESLLAQAERLNHARIKRNPTNDLLVRNSGKKPMLYLTFIIFASLSGLILDDNLGQAHAFISNPLGRIPDNQDQALLNEARRRTGNNALPLHMGFNIQSGADFDLFGLAVESQPYLLQAMNFAIQIWGQMSNYSNREITRFETATLDVMSPCSPNLSSS